MKKVLIAGPCTADANKIEKELAPIYSVEFTRTLTIEETKKALKSNRFDLLLINRVFAGDDKEGFEVLDYLSANKISTPAILFSRFPEYQQRALSQGAVASFDIDLIIGYVTPSRRPKHETAFKVIKDFLGRNI